jgi:hypothetical protein
MDLRPTNNHESPASLSLIPLWSAVRMWDRDDIVGSFRSLLTVLGTD